jgi:Lar family restriction alleviation protein
MTPTTQDAGLALLPCPFCGGTAEVERMGTPRVSMIYACEDCGARLETGEEWLSKDCRWNTRAPLADRLEALSQAATAEPEGWRGIESAPTDGRNVLVFCPRASDHGYNRIRLTWRKDGKWQGANNTSWPPTHWMPLPASPTVEER